jgi:hypothetical protein
LQDEKTKNTINSGHKYPDLLHGQLIFCMVDALVESWYPSGSFKTVLAINIILMRSSRSAKDLLVIAAAWLIAAALIYLVFIKFKLFFHK